MRMVVVERIAYLQFNERKFDLCYEDFKKMERKFEEEADIALKSI